MPRNLCFRIVNYAWQGILQCLFLYVHFNCETKNLGSGPLAQYKNLVEQGKLQHDPYQERVAFELEKLLGRLEQYEKDMEEYHVYFSCIWGSMLGYITQLMFHVTLLNTRYDICIFFLLFAGKPSQLGEEQGEGATQAFDGRS